MIPEERMYLWNALHLTAPVLPQPCHILPHMGTQQLQRGASLQGLVCPLHAHLSPLSLSFLVTQNHLVCV